MFKNKNVPVKTETITNKTFSYKKGIVSLSFSLRIDIKQDLEDFFECLNKAITDVSEQLNSEKYI